MKKLYPYEINARFTEEQWKWLNKNVKKGEIAKIIRYAIAKLMCE